VTQMAPGFSLSQCAVVLAKQAGRKLFLFTSDSSEPFFSMKSMTSNDVIFDPGEIGVRKAWGDYVEFVAPDGLILRRIRFWKGGATSLHRHSVGEFLAVFEGSVVVECGPDTSAMERRVLAPGESLVVPAGHWHRMAFSKSSSDQPYASAMELTSPDRSPIERAIPAQPSAFLGS
jgi:mannose-6-phosphate isomerase-like protein (cupin superfamily)